MFDCLCFGVLGFRVVECSSSVLRKAGSPYRDSWESVGES